jgi:hypothetical protein
MWRNVDFPEIDAEKSATEAKNSRISTRNS